MIDLSQSEQSELIARINNWPAGAGAVYKEIMIAHLKGHNLKFGASVGKK